MADLWAELKAISTEIYRRTGMHVSIVLETPTPAIRGMNAMHIAMLVLRGRFRDDLAERAWEESQAVHAHRGDTIAIGDDILVRERSQ